MIIQGKFQGFWDNLLDKPQITGKITVKSTSHGIW